MPSAALKSKRLLPRDLQADDVDRSFTITGTNWDPDEITAQVLRWNEDGALDGSFGIGGLGEPTLESDVARDVALDSNGRIVASGFNRQETGSLLDWAVAVYLGL